jgi:hypothetical protein
MMLHLFRISLSCFFMFFWRKIASWGTSIISSFYVFQVQVECLGFDHVVVEWFKDFDG